ncbi:MAG: hypothetical protein L7T84_09945 [Akkermansiaceae bacterium]|nr:hypothetical protein [Akkermansiaceae bacterium]
MANAEEDFLGIVAEEGAAERGLFALGFDAIGDFGPFFAGEVSWSGVRCCDTSEYQKIDE